MGGGWWVRGVCIEHPYSERYRLTSLFPTSSQKVGVTLRGLRGLIRVPPPPSRSRSFPLPHTRAGTCGSVCGRDARRQWAVEQVSHQTHRGSRCLSSCIQLHQGRASATVHARVQRVAPQPSRCDGGSIEGPDPAPHSTLHPPPPRWRNLG